MNTETNRAVGYAAIERLRENSELLADLASLKELISEVRANVN